MSTKRTASTHASKKAPITPLHLITIQSSIDFNDSVQFTVWTAILIGFYAALRKSNLAPPTPGEYDPSKHLSRRDIVVSDHGLTIFLDWTKTLQDRSKTFTIHVAKPPPASVVDPVATFIRFNQLHPVNPEDPAFSFYTSPRPSKLYVLSQSYLNKSIKDFMQSLGEDPINYSCHSLRRGSACIMSQSNLSPDLIQNHGTWTSSAYKGYIDFTTQQKLSVTQAMYHTINKLACK